jgi:tetratricopeptide (TPR) repeat protein
MTTTTTFTLPESAGRTEDLNGHRGIAVDPQILGRVRDLYGRGLMLQAYRVAHEAGALKDWRGPEARVLAARLAIHLGAPRMSYWHHVRAWREDRTHPEATYYYARRVLERRGPLAAWEFLGSVGELPESAPESVRADWLGLHSSVLALLRDFDAAGRWLARAEEIAPDRPWSAVERSFLREREDRPEAALEAARHALALRPWYRPAVQAAAHMLQQLDRDPEALALLEEADARLECGPIVGQLAGLRDEMGHYEEVRRLCDRFESLSPLLEPIGRKWLAARRADAAYHLGDRVAAASFARQSDDDFYRGIAERLEAGAEPRRILLDVGFVRQHHQTCGPATLTALGRFWRRPIDHLELAAAICYDGTPDHHERLWAERNGYLAREFTVTWDSAVALLERGVPFTLTTVEPTSAHLQAVIGYDDLRRSLVVRDPTVRHSGEGIADKLFERYRGTGPRGMTFVPAEEAFRLEGIELPDAPLYDWMFRLRRALEDHDRPAAAQASAAIEAAAPGHRVALQARRALALYDADRVTLLACVEGLLTLYPDDDLWLLQKLGALRDMAARDERLAFLRAQCDRRGSDSAFLVTFGRELAADTRAHDRAVRLLRRAIRLRPLDDMALAALAGILADRRQFDRALELTRFAACLNDKDEGHARALFSYARHLKRTCEVLEFLRARFDRLGRLSSAPARTLFDALEEADRTAEAFAVLDQALALRPDDGELLLFAADAHGRHGGFDRAAEWLDRARGRTPATAWLRAAASLARGRGDLPAARELWKQVVAAEPLAADAHRALAQLLAETAGREAALDHLRAACARFPHHVVLHRVWEAWLRDDGPTATEPVIRRMVAIHPADAWTRRELVLCLADQGRLDEAFAEMQIARDLEPDSASYHSVLGRLCLRAGRRDEAKAAFRAALAISVDDEFAFAQLIDACDTRAERCEALAFAVAELVRQVTFGDGLLAFQRFAADVLAPDELLARLREARSERPDLWHAHAALVRQLVALERLDEARAEAEAAAARFPLLPGVWLDLAQVHRARADAEGEDAAISRALEINPGWGTAVRHLSDLRERQGRLEDARAVLEAAVARAPLDPLNHGCLADILWKLGRHDEALECLRRALALEPVYDWAWSSLRAWSEESGRPEAAVEVARELTRRRPGDAHSWITFARLLEAGHQANERLDALDRALALDPHLTEAYDLKAEQLAEAGRFDEAAAACLAPCWDDRPPLILRGRAAWVEARRGNLDAALDRMRRALDDDPDYLWGWRQLTDWCDASRPAEEYLAAAQGLVACAPKNPDGYGHRGSAHQKLGDRDAARADFRRALELAPDYSFAGLTLFDMHMEDDDRDALAALLPTLEEHVGGPFVWARAVQFAARTGDRALGLANLARLCRHPEPATWPLQAAYEAARAAPWADAIGPVIDHALSDPEARPQVGWIWSDWMGRNKAWPAWKRIAPLLDRGKVGTEALAGFLQAVGRPGALGDLRRAWIVRRMLRRHGDVIRRDTFCWGSALYALATRLSYRLAVRWGADWCDRDGLAPWMLINLVLALRALGRHAESHAVAARAVELDSDYTTRYHTLWLALDAACSGNSPEADRLLSTVGDPTTMDATNRFLLALIRAMLSVQQADASSRRRAFGDARRSILAAALASSPLLEDRPAVARAYQVARRRLARDAGGPSGFLWGAFRAVSPSLPQPPTSRSGL